MDIKDLPSGNKFRASTGAGSFAKKISLATRYGEMKNLADNKGAILAVIKKHEQQIRRGNFGRLSQKAAFSEIIKKEGFNFTKSDKIDTKKLLKHLNERIAAVNKSKPVIKELSSAINKEGASVSSTAKSIPHFARAINRDPNNQRGFADINQFQTGLISSSSSTKPGLSTGIDRNKNANVAMRYENRLKTGYDTAAKSLQKNTFPRLIK